MNRRRFLGLSAVALGGSLLPGNAAAPDSKFCVVGYLPDYRLSPQVLSRAKYLTDLIAFSAQPRADGDLDMLNWQTVELDKLRQARKEHGCRLLLCVGGWKRSDGFREVLESAAARKRLVEALRDFCDFEKFDGVDLDWEHPKTLTDARNYGQFLELLKLALGKERLVTAAVAVDQPWWHEGERWLDRLHLMAYDLPGRHSTFSAAEEAVDHWLGQGLPPEKICLGLPLYGRGIKEHDKTTTYADLVAKPGFKSNDDEWEGFYFNGPNTMKAKVDMAKRKRLAGVMAWEIGQDAEGENSLLQTIATAVKK